MSNKENFNQLSSEIEAKHDGIVGDGMSENLARGIAIDFHDFVLKKSEEIHDHYNAYPEYFNKLFSHHLDTSRRIWETQIESQIDGILKNTVKEKKGLNVDLLESYVSGQLDSLHGDIAEGNSTIIPDEFLDGAEGLFSGIKSDMTKADSIDDVDQLLQLAKEKQLSGSIKGKDAWNGFLKN